MNVRFIIFLNLETPMARTTGSDGGRTEAAIRAAAVSLIARHGYEAVSMRQLATIARKQRAVVSTMSGSEIPSTPR